MARPHPRTLLILAVALPLSVAFSAWVADDQYRPHTSLPVSASLTLQFPPERPDLAADLPDALRAYALSGERSGLADPSFPLVVRYVSSFPRNDGGFRRPMPLVPFGSYSAGLVRVDPERPAHVSLGTLLHEFTHARVYARFGTEVYTPLNEGYATWVARSPVQVIAEAWSGCARLDQADFSRLDGELYVLSALPFAQAELDQGAPAAQELLARLVPTVRSGEAWTAVLRESCARLGATS